MFLLLLASECIRWMIYKLRNLISGNRHKRQLPMLELSHTDQLPSKIVLICKQQKTNETYTVSIEKKYAKE